MIASSDSLAYGWGWGGQRGTRESPHRLLKQLIKKRSFVCANLQSAAEGPDPVQPVIEQRVPGSLGETAPEILPAAGSWVPESRHIGLLQGPVQLL